MLTVPDISARPSAYTSILKSYGHLLEPRGLSPAIQHILKTYGPKNDEFEPLYKGGDDWDEAKHPRSPDGTFVHSAFSPCKIGAESFRRDLSRWFGMPGNIRNSGKALVLGDPPAVLRMLGVGPEPMQIDRGTLIKVVRPHGHAIKGHGITKEQLLQLPERIADPIAVFCVKGEDGLEVLTQLTDSRGEQVMVAVQIGKYVGSGKTVNDIASVYGRPDAEYMQWLAGGKLVYFDENKNPAGRLGLLPQLRRRVPERRGKDNIATPVDVVKFHSGETTTKSFDEQFDLLKSHIDALRGNHA